MIIERRVESIREGKVGLVAAVVVPVVVISKRREAHLREEQLQQHL